MRNKKVCFLFGLLLSLTVSVTGQLTSSFVETGTALHGGKNTPLWQAGNMHGLSSLDNNIYVRGGTFYEKRIDNWSLNAGLDMVLAGGFTSTAVLQQAYIEANYRWAGLSIGSKEINSPLLNQDLSSGGLTWSGNARPIPQVAIGIFDYVPLRKNIYFKAKLSFGWFTDNHYQKDKVGEKHWYTKDIKYHHKSFFFRFGEPQKKWNFDLGMVLDAQFGGYKIGGIVEGDLGNGFKDYMHILIPRRGKDTDKETYYQGNFLGSEYLRLNYTLPAFALSIYLENFYDDFSGMGKLNGMDGLWGIEYKSHSSQLINGVVLEYYQTTHQSGPLHGPDYSIVKKTGGADNYYNNDFYPGWVHWGMSMANPLIASPIYNEDGDMTFKYNRIKAFHLGWSGNINSVLSYRAKLSYNQTWGTPFEPTTDILENFSTFVETCYLPPKWASWSFKASAAFDIGDIYGDNWGVQLKIRRKF